MTTVFVSHKVRDYAAWLEGYNADSERRQATGITEGGHFHSGEDPNDFLIVWKTDMSAADALQMAHDMFNDPELEGLMAEAGVLEKPSFWVAEDTA